MKAMKKLRNFLGWFSQWRWVRSLVGGKWEQWWADPVNDYVWLDVKQWTPPGKRPGGCCIWDSDPKPNAREEYRTKKMFSE